jgi:hypothetical protein
MKKLLFLLSVIWLISSSAFAQQQNFMSILGESEVSLIQWTRVGNTAAGKYFRNWLTQNYDVQLTQANVIAKIKSNSIILNVGTVIYNGSLSKSGLSISAKNNDGTMSNRLFSTTSLFNYNKMVQALNSKSVKLKAFVIERSKVLEQITYLDGQTQDLYRTANETLHEIEDYQKALQKFLSDPTKLHHQDPEGASTLKPLLERVWNSNSMLNQITIYAPKGLDWCSDLQNNLQKIDSNLEAIPTLPDVSVYYSKTLETLYARALERLNLASSNTKRITAAASQYKLDFKPTVAPDLIPAGQQLLEQMHTDFMTFLKSFDDQAKAAALKQVQAYRDQAFNLITPLNCPKK